MPSDRNSVPPGGATMQLDAIADDLEEVAVPDLGEGVSQGAPPPLPPKKAGASVWIIGALVVLLATGLGLGVGLYVLNTSTPETPTAAAAPAEPEPEAAEPEPEASEAEEPATNVVSLDDVVFDGTEEPADDEPAPE